MDNSLLLIIESKIHGLSLFDWSNVKYIYLLTLII